MNIIEALVVTLKLDGTQYQSAMQKAQKSLEAFAGKERVVEQSRDKAQKEQARKQQEAERKASRERDAQLRNAAEGYRRVRNEIIGMVGAAMGMASIKSFVTNSVNGLVNVGRAATDLNMSARSVAAWGRTIETVGGKSEDMIGTMRAMSLAVANAKEGFDVDSPFFAFLNNQGIKWQNASGKIREMGQMLPEIADAFNKFRPEQQAILAKQFGWSDDFVALMRKGSAEVRRIYAEKYALGKEDEASIKRAEQFKAEWSRISSLFESTGQKIFLSLVPALEKINDLLLRFANWVSENSDTISAFFVGVANVVTIAAEMFSKLHGATGGWSTGILAAVTALVALKGVLGGILSLTGLPMLLKLLGGGASVGGLGLLGTAGLAAGASYLGLQAAKAAGLPETDKAKGIDAVRSGEWWKASALLPASELMHALEDKVINGKSNKEIADKLQQQLNDDEKASKESNGYLKRIEAVTKRMSNALISPAGATNMSGMGGASSGPVSASMQKRIDHAMSYFMAKGWSREQAAGIVANLKQESGLSPNPRGSNDGGKAFGVAQWHGDRQAAFRRVFGKDIRSATLEEQYAFVDWELRNSHSRAGNMLRGATGSRDAAGIVSRYYEIPANADREAAMRGASAAAIAAGASGASQMLAMNRVGGGNTGNRSEVNIGNITINTAATDAAGISREIRPAVNRHMAGVTALGMN